MKFAAFLYDRKHAPFAVLTADSYENLINQLGDWPGEVSYWEADESNCPGADPYVPKHRRP